MNWTTLVFESPFVTRLLSTLVLIGIILGVRSMLLRRFASRQDVDATTRRRWIVTTRNTVFLVILGIVVVIWLEQLRAVAATVVVIAAAIVVATKMLSATVKNETRLWGDYVFHLVTIPVEGVQGWEMAEKALLQAANRVCAPYLKKAQESMTLLSRHHSLESPSVTPRVNVQVAAADKVNLILRMPVPTRHRGRLEQEVTRHYLKTQSRRLSSLPQIQGGRRGAIVGYAPRRPTPKMR